jgi:membrane associated rhomboid family serine protease
MNEKYNIIKILKGPLIFLFIIWGVKLIEIIWESSFIEYGLIPRKLSGLKGIIFSPIIHKDLKHLMNNTLPILILGGALCFFYKKNHKKIFIWLFIVSGLFLWGIGRPNFHIGASGIIYALASFIFFSGVLSKNKRLSALSLIVIFIYGGLFWGLFPTHQEVSWEGHLSGFIAGLIISWFFKDDLPKRKKYQWEIDEEKESEDNGLIVNYEYTEK